MWKSEYKHYVIILVTFFIIGITLILKSDTKIGIKGEVLEISSNEQGNIAILVDGSDVDNKGYDKAYITIIPMTLIYRGESSTRISYDEIKVGDIVEIIVKGEVRELYPVQADADAIRIVE